MTYFVMRGPDLPTQEIVVGRVTAVSNSRSAFAFETNEGDKTGFPISRTQGAAAIRVGAQLRLVIVEGDGYQVVVSASPVPGTG